VTATLARTTAGRAIGSAAGSAAFPGLVLVFGLSATTATIAVALLATSVAAQLFVRSRHQGGPGGSHADLEEPVELLDPVPAA
jgi:hypothetical protein